MGEASRAEHNKLRDVAVLRAILAEHELYAPFNDDDLSIDNSALSPEEVAARIADHARL